MLLGFVQLLENRFVFLRSHRWMFLRLLLSLESKRGKRKRLDWGFADIGKTTGIQESRSKQ